MNNVLDIVLTRIRLAIPKELLDLAFTVREPHEKEYPVEQMVLEKVIRGIVRKEANIYGGKQKKIVLLPEYREKLKYDKSDAYTFTGPFSLYRIPPCEREGQAIVDVDGLTYRGNYAGYVPHVNGWAGGADVSTVGAGVMDSHTFASHPPRPNVTLLSGDLVRLTPSQHATIIWILHCRIGYDEQFTNLNPQAIDSFIELCIAATKMYVYNKLVIPTDKAWIESGYELNSYKIELDRYQDQADRYRELLKEFCGGAQLDPERIMQVLPYLL